MVYVSSLGVGLAVGVVYGLLGLRSPAPPVAALLGLLGMLAGESAVAAVKRAVVERDRASSQPALRPTQPDRSDDGSR